MIYKIKPGDTLFRIAQRNRTTVETLMQANVICNSKLIFPGEIIMVPQPGLNLPRMGGGPYYIVMPADTLGCLATQFGTKVEVLARNNRVKKPDRVHAYSELLVITDQPDLKSLRQQWESTPGSSCIIKEPQRYAIYYQGTFRWQALGSRAVPVLIDLLGHRCAEVRYYAIMSLGRLAVDHGALDALEAMKKDSSKNNRHLAMLASDRIILASQGYRRTHLLINADTLLDDINKPTPVSVPLAAGTSVTVMKWFVPSPMGKTGPAGGIQIYDYVQVIASGQTGYLARQGKGEINLI